MLNDIFKTVGPIIAAAMAGKFENTEFRFDNGKFHVDGDWDGVPVEDFDLTQTPPEKIVVLGAVRVFIAEGKTFRIQTPGEGPSLVRLAQREGKLVIARRDRESATAEASTVEITMPAPRSVTLAGAGFVEIGALADDAGVSITGSGSVMLNGVTCTRLKAKVLGSGRLHAIGSVEHLKLVSAGSGEADLAQLDVGKAQITITGSGSARLACDGEVEAKMMGSGNVTVYGRARSRVQSLGSGRFNCLPRDDRDDRGKGEPDAPEPPKPPEPPKSGGAAAKAKGASPKSKPAKATKATKPAKPAKPARKKRKAPASKSE
uniref:GIN domain-containing protein n=1 Tax=Parerythrobacter lutipelagi TaxID=1964208 RepID=UPI0010F51DE6|nr:DUF2807 domain-containing protein [Parerythrobacter lutipelagi]